MYLKTHRSDQHVKFSHNFNKMSVRKGIKRIKRNISLNSHDYPTKKSMVLVRRMIILILRMKGLTLSKRPATACYDNIEILLLSFASLFEKLLDICSFNNREMSQNQISFFDSNIDLTQIKFQPEVSLAVFRLPQRFERYAVDPAG